MSLVIGDEAADEALVWTLAPGLTLPPGAAGSSAALPAPAAARLATTQSDSFLLNTLRL